MADIDNESMIYSPHLNNTMRLDVDNSTQGTSKYWKSNSVYRRLSFDGDLFLDAKTKRGSFDVW